MQRRSFQDENSAYRTWYGALPFVRCAVHINYTLKEPVAGYNLSFSDTEKDGTTPLSCELQWASGDTQQGFMGDIVSECKLQKYALRLLLSILI